MKSTAFLAAAHSQRSSSTRERPRRCRSTCAGTLDHAVTVVQVYGLTDFHVKNAVALERLKTEFKRKVEILPLPTPVLRELKELAAEVVREESEKMPMAKKVHASFSRRAWPAGPRISEGAYHQFVAL